MLRHAAALPRCRMLAAPRFRYVCRATRLPGHAATPFRFRYATLLMMPLRYHMKLRCHATIMPAFDAVIFTATPHI